MTGLDRRAFVTGLSATPLALAGCVSPSASFHFRQTLTISHKGQNHSGSTVQEYIVRGWSSELASPNATSTYLRGDGAIIDLGIDGVVVSTLVQLADPAISRTSGEHPVFGNRPPTDRNWRAGRFLSPLILGERSPEVEPAAQWAKLATLQKSAVVRLPPDEIPMLLYFPEPANSRSVRWVDPLAEEGVFAPISMDCSITQDEITRGVVDRALPWLPDFKLRHATLSGSGSGGGDGLPGDIYSSDISRI